MSIWVMEGSVLHARVVAPGNAFLYPTFMLLVDVDDMLKTDRKFCGGTISLKSSDFLFGRKHVSLAQEVRELIRDRFAFRPQKILLLAYPRMLGYAFHPVSFWFCVNEREEVSAILCEVNNTFGERHFYWLDGANQKSASELSFATAKEFHVSPFFPVSGTYQYRFKYSPQELRAEIDYYDPDLRLRTKLDLRRAPFSEASMLKTVLRHGWVSLGVIFRIHAQAFRLWWRRAKFYPKPALPKEDYTR